MSSCRPMKDTPERSRPSGAEIARLVVVLLVAVLLQTTVAPNLRLLGANPDFALIVVVCRGPAAGLRDRRRVRLPHRDAHGDRAHRAASA